MLLPQEGRPFVWEKLHPPDPHQDLDENLAFIRPFRFQNPESATGPLDSNHRSRMTTLRSNALSHSQRRSTFVRLGRTLRSLSSYCCRLLTNKLVPL